MCITCGRVGAAKEHGREELALGNDETVCRTDASMSAWSLPAVSIWTI